jgi:hypothetical protein
MGNCCPREVALLGDNGEAELAVSASAQVKSAPPAPAPAEHAAISLFDDSGEADAAASGAAPVKEENASIVAAAAAAAAEARKLDKKDEGQEAWKKHDGAQLETALATDVVHYDSPVRLIDARFLIELHKRGGRLCRRQEIPDAAFLSLEELKRLPKGGQYNDCLRVASASHAWQQPDHPDPKGTNLEMLARFLEIRSCSPRATPLMASSSSALPLDHVHPCPGAHSSSIRVRAALCVSTKEGRTESAHLRRPSCSSEPSPIVRSSAHIAV